MALTREKSRLERLEHPGIVKCFELFEESGFYYLVLEFLSGQTLHQKMMQEGPQNEPDVRHWGMQLCDIFEYLHQKNPPIIYRDLKPENLMLDQDRVRLIDFGIARVHKGDRNSVTEMMGSVNTASPEHYGGAETDGRSDIYTLGATLYDLLTGGERERIRAFSFAPVRDLNAQVSTDLEQSLMKALAFEPEERFQTMAEFRSALRPKQASQPPKRSYLKTALLALLLVVVGAVGALKLVPTGESSRPEVDTGFHGDIFLPRIHRQTATVSLGEDVGLLTLSDGFGLTAEDRAREISRRLNQLYHELCPLCQRMKLEPEGFRAGRLVLDSQGQQREYTAVFYAHIDNGNYFEKPMLLATMNQEQAERMGATKKFAALYWRGIAKPLTFAAFWSGFRPITEPRSIASLPSRCGSTRNPRCESSISL